jgi:hypothetical protein
MGTPAGRIDRIERTLVVDRVRPRGCLVVS